MIDCFLPKTPLLDRCFIPASSKARLSGRGGLWRGAEGDETEAGVVEILRFAYNDVFVIH
jgi:hypothetical protein